MKLIRKLSSPVALVAQGFVLGALLFFTTHPGSGRAAAELAVAGAAVLPGA